MAIEMQARELGIYIKGINEDTSDVTGPWLAGADVGLCRHLFLVVALRRWSVAALLVARAAARLPPSNVSTCVYIGTHIRRDTLLHLAHAALSPTATLRHACLPDSTQLIHDGVYRSAKIRSPCGPVIMRRDVRCSPHCSL